MPKMKWIDWVKLVILVLPYIKTLADAAKEGWLDMIRALLDLIWQQQLIHPEDGQGPIRFQNLSAIFASGLATADEAFKTPEKIMEALKQSVAIIVDFLQDRGYLKRSGTGTPVTTTR